ncbi:putative L-type amino acid transporter 1-like protein MLAS [Amphiura filiformis]|uniref:putative L-type amino acid transporter 1-like protein MLAS n=1 Tax=Amphiura filiformis TaxID=82378 RepID=UPI003B21A366
MADDIEYKSLPSQNGVKTDVDRNANEKPTVADEDVVDKPSANGGDVVRLERNMGLFSGITIIVGNIIGSGVFLTPSTVLKYAGSVGMSITVWAGAGLFSLIGALCFLELGTTIPRSGAEYIYIKEIVGDLPAFMVLWVTMVVVAPVSRILTCMTFANYILQPFYPEQDCRPPDEVVAIFSVACISKYHTVIPFCYITVPQGQ